MDYFCEVCHQPITGDDIEDRHTAPDGEDCHAACCPRCSAPKYRYTYSTGRCANGAQSDQGHLYHAIPLPADGSPASDWAPALCGFKPGRRSNGWSSYEAEAPTCAKCAIRVKP